MSIHQGVEEKPLQFNKSRRLVLYCLVFELIITLLVKPNHENFQDHGYKALTMIGDGATDFEVRKSIGYLVVIL